MYIKNTIRNPFVKGNNMSEEENKVEQKENDKELNFRKLEAKYERQIAQERAERQAEIKKIQEEYQAKLNQFQRPQEDEDEEVYIDKRRLGRELSDFEKKMEQKYDKRAEEKARNLLKQEKQENWLKNNPDFYEVLEKHADEFAQKNPGIAERILNMPEGIERQQLVYENIKALGLDKPKETIQDTVNQRQQGPYYQPTQIGNAPYNSQGGDFSPGGQKNAYNKLQELKARLRL